MSQYQELLSLLSRVDALAILASAAYAEAAVRLRRVLVSRGCAVAAAVEGLESLETLEAIPATASQLQAVLVLGESPRDPEAFSKERKLAAASGMAFAAISAGAPVRVLQGSRGLEDLASLVLDLKRKPRPSALDAQKRWEESLAALLADDAKRLEESLESWPELLVQSDSTGNSLLHRAASAGALQATALLLERGASANLRNQEEGFRSSGGNLLGSFYYTGILLIWGIYFWGSPMFVKPPRGGDCWRSGLSCGQAATHPIWGLPKVGVPYGGN